MLNNNRFSSFKGVCRYNLKEMPIEYYTYESERAIYDVLFLPELNKFYFRINMQPVDSTNKANKFHLAIINHFGLTFKE